MDYGEIAVAFVAVIGVALLLYGMSLPEFTSELVVEDPVEASGVDDEEIVAHGDLEDENRAAFDRALREGGATNYENHRWRAEVVEYDGQYYRTSTWGGENGTRILTILAGLGTILVGAIGFVGIRVRKRWASGRKEGTSGRSS